MNNKNNNTTPGTTGDIIADKAGNKPSAAGNSNPSEIDYKKMYEQELQMKKDTQKSYTQGQQELSVLKKQNKMLNDAASKGTQLTPEQVDELEVLKYKDPDAWFDKKQAYTNLAKANLLEANSKAHDEGMEEAAETTKQATIANFLTSNTDLTMDMINLDVPKRIHKELDDGNITLEEFLEKSKHYILSSTKRLQDKADLDQKNLTKVPGGNNPSKQATQAEHNKQAQDEIY